jgi:acyl carrier protein
MDQRVSTLTEETVREQVRDFIKMNFLYDGDISNLDDAESFLAAGIVDTTGVLELVLFVEDAYGLTVEQDDLLPENFDSVNNLTRYIIRMLG